MKVRAGSEWRQVSLLSTNLKVVMAARLPVRLTGPIIPSLVLLLLVGASLGIEGGSTEDGGSITTEDSSSSPYVERIARNNSTRVGDGFVVPKVKKAGWDSDPIDGIHEILDVYNVDRLKRILDGGGSGELNDACAVASLEFVEAWKQGKPWAMAMSDSSGRYSSQFFIGDGFWLGSSTLCESLDPRIETERSSTPDPTLNSVEHETSVLEKAPYPLAFVSSQFHMVLPKEFRPSSRTITLGLCLPKSCTTSNKDMIRIARYLSGANETQSLKDLPKGPDVSLTVSQARKVPGDYEPLKDSILVTLLVVTAILFVMIAIGTALDIIDRRSEAPRKLHQKPESKMDWLGCEATSNNIRNGKPGQVECNGNHLKYVQGTPTSERMTAEEMSDDGKDWKTGIGSTVKGVLLCFSLRYNVPKLFEKPPPADHSVGPSLTCLHGLRVFSLIWVITGHACLVAFTFVDNKSFRGMVEKDFLFQSVSQGAFSVDTFFFISGLLVTYLFFKAIGRPKVQVVSTTTAKSDLFKFLGILTYRFIRLTPSYLFVIGVVNVEARWLLDKSVFPPPSYDHVTCPKYWWRNILYISTFYPVTDMCMVWSWYLADDTQFYTLAVILLLLSTRYFRTAVTLGSLILVSSWFTTGIITYSAKHSPSIENPFSMFDEVYDKPWTRLGPYVIGMVVGYMLTQEIVYRKLSKMVLGIMWMLSIGMTFTLVYGLYGRSIGPVESAAHTALSHTSWGLAIGWIVIACSTGRGGPVNRILSSRVLVPFSRLSFCAYLVHPIVMFAVFMHSDAPIHLTRDTMVMAIGGFIISSYMLAFLISMAIEAPSIRLLEFIHPIKKRLREEAQRSREASISTLSR